MVEEGGPPTAIRDAGHVGFGAGIHHRDGHVLARMEGEAMLGALARKVTVIEITAPPKRRYNGTLRALARLPVRIAAASGDFRPAGRNARPVPQRGGRLALPCGWDRHQSA